MNRKTIKKSDNREIKSLLNQQTDIILDAVDKKIERLEKRFNLVDQEMLTSKKRLDLMEMRINQKFERLTTTLDRFLKRMVDLEDEFIIMKADLNNIKTILREKLGIAVD